MKKLLENIDKITLVLIIFNIIGSIFNGNITSLLGWFTALILIFRILNNDTKNKQEKI